MRRVPSDSPSDKNDEQEESNSSADTGQSDTERSDEPNSNGDSSVAPQKLDSSVAVSVMGSPVPQSKPTPVTQKILTTKLPRTDATVSSPETKHGYRRDDSVMSVQPSQQGRHSPTEPTGAADEGTGTPVLESVSVATRASQEKLLSSEIDETVVPVQRTDRDTADPVVADKKRVETISHDVSEPVTPTERTTQTTGDEKPETEEHDPLYRWGGGTPYSSTKPQLIVHIAPEEIPSLPFIQRVLRDTYRELNGGVPRISSVTTTGPTTDIPRVSDRIVTLDLTEDRWSVSVDPSGASVTKEADSTEFTDLLKAATESMYGGGLGYLVVNVDASDIRPPLIRNGPEEFVRTLLDADDLPYISTGDGLFELAGAPVRLAELRTDSGDQFRDRVSSYFALESHEFDRVADIEAQSDQVLARESWTRTVLTARQDERGNESATHYRWKAALVGGLARCMRTEYIAFGESTGDDLTLERFVKENLLSEGVIDTEESTDDADICPDIEIKVNSNSPKPWLRRGVARFADLEHAPNDRLALEFETGFSEGQFNHRKLRHTVEKYGEQMGQSQCVRVVVPPRILFRDRRRAEFVRRLVDTWPLGSTNSVTSELCVPVVDDGHCRRLRSATDVIDEWFATVSEDDD